MWSTSRLLDALELPPATAARVDRRQFASLDRTAAERIQSIGDDLNVHLIVYQRAHPPLAHDTQLCHVIEPAQLDAEGHATLVALERQVDGIVVAYRRPVRLRTN